MNKTTQSTIIYIFWFALAILGLGGFVYVGFTYFPQPWAGLSFFVMFIPIRYLIRFQLLSVPADSVIASYVVGDREICIEQIVMHNMRSRIDTTCVRLRAVNTTTGKRLYRLLLGDSVTYLGRWGNLLWLLNDSRWYGQPTGLLAKDISTGRTVAHFSKRQFQFPALPPTAPETQWTIQSKAVGTSVTIDLQTGQTVD